MSGAARENAMTAVNDKVRHYRTLEVLIQSQLAALTGPEQGIVVVLPHIKRLDAYTTVGAGLDLTNPDSLKQLKWVQADKSHAGWACKDVEEAWRNSLIENLARQ